MFAGDKRSPPSILGQRRSFNCIGGFNFLSICSHSCIAPTNMHGMNGMWPRRPWR